MSTYNSAARKTILLVEDEALIAMDEEAMLRRHGFDVFSACNAEAALAAAAEHTINLILMDIDLGPDRMDGTGAAKIILQDHDIPVVFLSNHTEPEVVEKTENITSYGYVVKNSGETVLIASVKMAFRLFESRKSEREKEEALRASEANLLAISELSADYAYSHACMEDGSLMPVWHTGSFDRITGYTPEELYKLGGWPSLIHKDDLPGAADYVRNLLSGKEDTFVARIVTKGGETRWIRDRGKPRFDKETGKVIGTFGSARDITEEVLAKQKLSAMVTEKDFLLRELNHRVKNNLMMISSLISLKNESLAGQADLSDLKNQIEAIRLVHEKLLQAAEKAEVRIRDYAEDLLQTVFSFTGKGVITDIDTDDISMDTATIVPLGLIINEIATNALKHGFADTKEPRFTLRMRKDPKVEQYILVLSNNGAPIPPGVNPENPATLGLRLVSALVRQIDGTLELRKAPHPAFTIRFS